MNRLRGKRSVFLATLLLCWACGHSASMLTSPEGAVGPFASSSDERLTFSAGSDYWPNWSADGQGILYQFSQPGRSDDDRCLGLIPAGGGSQVWTMCEVSGGEADSSSSYGGFALNTIGKVLYVESTSKKRTAPPAHINLWLGDSGSRANRRKLTEMPVTVSGNIINWLRDIAWTGPTTFVALGQDFHLVTTLTSTDSAYTSLIIVQGSINTSGVSFTGVAGTGGASSWSLADFGTSIVLARPGLTLERVKLTGGAVDTVAVLPSDGTGRGFISLSCQGSACVVATSEGSGSSAVYRLWSVAFSGGSFRNIYTTSSRIAAVRLSPVNNDLVISVAPQSNLDLHLLLGIFP